MHWWLLLALVGSTSCAPDRPAALVERSFVSMGSSLRVAIWTTDEAGAAAAAARVAAEFDRLDALLSVWRDGSDVVRMNAAAGVSPVPVSPETIDVLEAGLAAGHQTGGKFDITFGALADLWKFDHDQDNTIPARTAVEARLPLVDYTAVRADRQAGTAFVSRSGMRVHLGGIGKGYAIDRGADLLRAGGFHHFLIQSGGDLYVSGTRGGAPWALGIADPRQPDRVFASLRLTNATLSTSGDYERFFVKDGVRYHHLLDPDAGEPARLCRSVTIVSTRAILADALSTGVFILGPDAGMALIERLPGVEGVIVTAADDVLVSSGLRGKVEM
jgi:thiamine biosynthesis lipoprotein